MPYATRRRLTLNAAMSLVAVCVLVDAATDVEAASDQFRGGLWSSPDRVLKAELHDPSASATERKPSATTAAPVVLPPAATAIHEPGFVFVFEQDIKAFLADYCRRVGLRPEIDGGVRGRLTKTRLPLDFSALMADLGGRFEIEWYLEGDSLRVAPRSELTTRVVSLRSVRLDDLTEALKASDLDTARYPMRMVKDADAIIVRAPSSYVSRVLAVVETLGRGNNDGVVRVYRYGAEENAGPRAQIAPAVLGRA